MHVLSIGVISFSFAEAVLLAEAKPIARAQFRICREKRERERERERERTA
jgi:hypothetical protein